MFSFLLLRFGTLLTSVEYVSWDEEKYRGTIAKELIEGLKVPLWDYQADGYDGGSLAVGILTVPFFLLLGPNLFALKLVALGFSLATLVFSFFFFKKFFDERIALLVCLILILSPPGFTALSLCTIGSHPDSILFTIVILFCFYQFMYGKRNQSVFLVLFGLVSGLGFWFTSITFITLLTCLASWFFLDRASFLSKKLFIFSGSFLVGALPFLFYNATHHFRSVGFFMYFFLWKQLYASLGEQLAFIPIRMAGFVLKVLPPLFRFRPFLGIPGEPLTVLYGLTAWPLIGLFVWREGRRLLPILRDSLQRGKIAPNQMESTKPMAFLLFPFLYLLIYGVSNFPLFPVPQQSFVGLRYLSPLYYFSFSLLALALRGRRLALPLTILLSLGLVGQGSLLFNEPFGMALKYKGYSYFFLGKTWGENLYSFPEKFAEFPRLADRFKEPERPYLYWGVAFLVGWLRREHIPEIVRMEKDPKFASEVLHRVPAQYRRYFLENWGRHLGRFREEAFDRNRELGNLISEEERPYFYYGLATKTLLSGRHETLGARLRSIPGDPPLRWFYYFDLGRSLYWDLEPKGWKEAKVEIPDSLGAEEKSWVYRGMGAEAAVSWALSLNFTRTFDSLVAKLPLEGHPDFFWGMGWGLRAGTPDEDKDLAQVLNWFDRLRPETQAWARKGVEAFEKWYGVTLRG